MKRVLIFIGIMALIISCKGKSSSLYQEAQKEEGQSYKFQGCIEPDTFIKLAKRVGPAVVNINTSTTVKLKGYSPFGFFEQDENQGRKNDKNDLFERFFGVPDKGKGDKTFKQNSLGSGFIISKDGYIITNNHVVEKADEINVTLADESKNYKVKIIGKDPKTDVALIKIEASMELTPVVLGDSDKLRVGEVVVAIGNPFGLSHTVTQGIVSAKGRSIGLGNYESFIQTDASINPGNSGGPLLNIDGEVVGINTAIVATGQGIGFSIPINMAKNVVTQLKEKGKVSRAWIGVYIQKITEDLAKSLKLESRDGALVSSVAKDSPAEKAGIKPGDIILKFDGRDIKDFNELPLLVSSTPVGKKCEIVFKREENKITMSIVLEELKDEEVQIAQTSEGKLGLTVESLTKNKAKELGLDSSGGIIVKGIEEDSPALENGLQKGDVIVEINKKKIANVNDYNKITASLKKGDNVLLFIKRGRDTTLFIAFTL